MGLLQNENPFDVGKNAWRKRSGWSGHENSSNE
jgi:hypothetical protein